MFNFTSLDFQVLSIMVQEDLYSASVRIARETRYARSYAITTAKVVEAAYFEAATQVTRASNAVKAAYYQVQQVLYTAHSFYSEVVKPIAGVINRVYVKPFMVACEAVFNFACDQLDAYVSGLTETRTEAKPIYLLPAAKDEAPEEVASELPETFTDPVTLIDGMDMDEEIKIFVRTLFANHPPVSLIEAELVEPEVKPVYLLPAAKEAPAPAKRKVGRPRGSKSKSKK